MMTKEGIYTPSITYEIEPAFEKYCKGKTFLDLGSGNGQVLGLAFKYGSMVTGIEIEKDFYENSQFKEYVMNDDMFKSAWGVHDILYYYLKGCKDEDRIVEKLNEEARDYFFLYTDGSNQSEINRFTKNLKCKLIESNNHLYIFRFHYGST